MITETDHKHLQRCVELAEIALEAGDAPFGSVLVDADGGVVAEARNRTSGGDSTQHPEFALARGATGWLSEYQRREATVYTSGEHCPMCAAAHAWVGLGRIVHASSSEQLLGWLDEMGAALPPVTFHPIGMIAPGVPVDGPVPDLAERVYALQRRYYGAFN